MLNNPVYRRQWAIFKDNRLGYWSLWLFAVLFTLSLLSNVIANDRPLLVEYQNHYYFPIVNDYPETTFGGYFETSTDYRDPYVQQLINQQGFILWPMVRFSYDTINYKLQQPAPSPPSADNWLGTDNQGRDVLARVLYGFRISVLFGLMLTLASSLVGIAVGALQGYYGGWTDLLGQRFMEVWSGMPLLYLIIILSSFIAPGFWTLLIIMLLFSWMALVDLVRAEFLRCRNLDYVRAAKAMGVSAPRIMLRHMLPNAMVSTLTFLPFILSGSVATLTTLDFLGFGMPVGSPSLGELIGEGKANIQAPWLGIAGFVTLATLLSLLVFIGAAARDAFDPRKYLK